MTARLPAIIAALGCAGAVQAGGIDRSGQSIAALFEQGRHVEFSLGSVSPETSGTSVAALGSVNSGNMAEDFLQFGAAYKADINSQLSYAIIYDQPFGADVAYPTGTGYYAAGSRAEFESHAVTGLLNYRINENFSVHGGLRVQSVKASAAVPVVNGYTVTGDSEVGVGYVAGMAYEMPEIALRVALTYNSSIDYDVATSETFLTPGGFATVNTTTSVETPQSVNLAFQTGVAEDTLLFGGIRWTDYSAFTIAPAGYTNATGAPLLSYDDDVFTYSLGLGRRLTDQWSIAATVGYEKSQGGFAANLGPTDGNTSVGLAATYSMDAMTITTGVRYVDIGDAQTQFGPFAPAANFTDNKAVAIGVKVAYKF